MMDRFCKLQRDLILTWRCFQDILIVFFKKNFKTLLVIIFVFIYILLIFLLSSYYQVSFPGDAFNATYGFWIRSFLNKPFSLSFFSDLEVYPFGTLYKNFNIIYSFFSYPFSKYFNEVFSFNIISLSSFVLSYLTSYFAFKYFSRSRLPSIFAAFIFTFSPYHLFQSQYQLSLAQVQWIPLLLFALVFFLKDKSWKSILLLSISFLLNIYSDMHYGFFSFIIISITVLYFLLVFVSKRQFEEFKFMIFRVLSFSLITIIGSMPILIPAVKIIIFGQKGMLKRAISDLYMFNPIGWEYFIPPNTNPIFGNILTKYLYPHLPKTGTEVLYIGYVLIALALIGFVFVLRTINNSETKYREYELKADQVSNKNFVILSIILIFVMFYISLPPTVKLFGHEIYNPTYFLYRLIPFIRIYSRIVIFTIAIFCIYASFGLKLLLEKLKKRSLKILLISGLGAIVMLEYAFIPGFVPTRFKDIPNEYQWLAKQPGDVSIVEYKNISSDTYTTNTQSEYLFYQRYHHKKLFNTTAYPIDEHEIYAYETTFNINNPEAINILAFLGVDYAILHYPNDLKKVEQVNNIPNLSLVKSFSNADVYSIANSIDRPNLFSPSRIIYFDGNLSNLNDLLTFSFPSAESVIYFSGIEPDNSSFFLDKSTDFIVPINILKPVSIAGEDKIEASYDDQGSTPSVMEASQIYKVRLIIKNLGSEIWVTDGKTPIRLGYHWMNNKENRLNIFDGKRTNLKNYVLPGESIELDATIESPEQPGVYTLQYDLLKENIFWFSNMNIPMLERRVIVVDKNGSFTSKNSDNVWHDQPYTMIPEVHIDPMITYEFNIPKDGFYNILINNNAFRAFEGRFRIDNGEWKEFYINRVVLGFSDIEPISLAKVDLTAGKHEITFTNVEFAYDINGFRKIDSFVLYLNQDEKWVDKLKISGIKKISNNNYELEINGGPGFIYFDKPYKFNWGLYISNELDNKIPRFLANGYGNLWYVEDKIGKVSIKYND